MHRIIAAQKAAVYVRWDEWKFYFCFSSKSQIQRWTERWPHW